MKPEELKIIAEGMEYWSVWVYDGAVYIHKEGLGEIRFMPEGEIFNPLTNDTQCMEIIVKCGISIYVDSTGDGRYVKVWDSDIYFYELYDRANNEPGFEEYELAMIRRLVCKAALEYFKE